MSFWTGQIPEQCQLCSGPIQGMFVDGRIKGTTQWGIMCPHCHRTDGVGLGTGLGQMYSKDTHPESPNFGKFVKIKG